MSAGVIAHREGLWFIADGAAVSLHRRRTLAALLQRLGEERCAAPGGALPLDALVAAAWPGERIARPAARNRLHVAVHALRSLGLGATLHFHARARGYLLDPGVPFRFEDGAAPALSPGRSTSRCLGGASSPTR